ncbi:hypothetical protein MNEG_11761 [Monoraphidium neglectum]|uniref:Lipoyl-binding domain-containing protein n=1 Tax=Monoraphidium neglectum TaxID=145388 RepID=A0A0D2M4L1_9CHLO|nr:hypothetical protein MNEG_11761 [Monoraphidium neglectum]KIY96201.1 hypothetical protein MNEG_11761 [Monoraphidium neglectum]|eukprot:XP_013895221.1 hypothetical protein MNEG_11761 [Monoraphidium neglectum]
MQEGTIRRWLKAEGKRVQQYDLLCEVDTQQLVEEAYRLGDFAGSVTLLIESQEDGVLARRLAPEGATLPVGAPIAVVWEESGGGGGDGDADAGRLAAARRHTPPTKDVYDESQPSVRVLEWQSYLKESSEDPGAKKCMG